MDPYVYPGTNVLTNLRDIRDLATLGRFEADATSRRNRQLEQKPPRGTFGLDHIKAIHRHIFQDVCPWAGEIRTVDIARPGQFYFALCNQIVPCLNNTLEQLRKERNLADTTSTEQFATRAAWYMGELNAIHPFRDGNGRTQREFIRQLALKNGYTIHWSRVTRIAMNQASAASFESGQHRTRSDSSRSDSLRLTPA